MTSPHGAFLPVPNAFLTDGRFGPEMVRRRAGTVFDYYLILLRRLHEAVEGTCILEVGTSEIAFEIGIEAKQPAVTLNRCNHQLADVYGLVRYEPAPGRRPRVTLLDLREAGQPYRAPVEGYFKLPFQFWRAGWATTLSLKAKFFLLVSIHEHARNTATREAGGPDYWFRSIEHLAERYHVAMRTTTAALKELWKAGVLGIERADYQSRRANRYFYRDIIFSPSFHARFEDLEFELGAERFVEARELAARLDAENRPEALQLMAELLEEYEEADVEAAVDLVAAKSLRSPVRTPEYVRGILRNWRTEGVRDDEVVREVPFLGYVAAGPPVLAEEQALGSLRARVPGHAPEPLFALRIEGDSMIDAEISDGDYVIVAAQPVAEDGDIVLALFNGEYTVKRLLRLGHHVALKPENDRYEAMLVGPDDELVIQGKVVAVSRSATGEASRQGRPSPSW